MAFDEALAARIRDGLDGVAGVSEKKMFGGVCFLLNDNMLCGVSNKGDLIARVGAEAHAASMKLAGVRAFDMGMGASNGMVFVAPTAIKKDGELKKWLQRCVAFVSDLPPKKKKKPAAKAKKK
jgi:hypothetical protein